MLPSPLILRSSTTRAGGPGELERALRGGEVVRLRHGAYVDAAVFAAATAEQRMRWRAEALDAVAHRPPVFAGPTAAALWRLALHGPEEPRVHTLDAGPRPASSRADVVRHHAPLPATDLVPIDGVSVTSLSRTLYDLIRTSSVERAVAAFDSALRLVAWRGFGDFDDAAAEALRQEVHERIERAPGARGIRQARFVTAFADGRAQLPGESISRLWMHRMRAEPPLLQLELRVAGGRAFPDFAWPRLRKFGEFDGDAKYSDPRFTAGRDTREVLRDQRARESAIVAATDWAPVRWGWERLTTPQVFGKFLLSHRLIPTR